jgi:hypothetical protein
VILKQDTSVELRRFPRSDTRKPPRSDAFKVYRFGQRIGTVATRAGLWRWSRWYADGVPYFEGGSYFERDDAAVALVNAHRRAKRQAARAA